MAFTRQQPFSKKTTDLPDVPSPAYTPTQIKEYIETPSDENKSFVDSFLNELEADAGAGNVGAKKADGTSSTVQTALDEKQTKTALSNVTGATLVGAKKGDGTTSTVQGVLDEKAVKGGDWTGTWQGYTPSKADPGISSVVDQHTSQLAETSNIRVSFEHFGGKPDNPNNAQAFIDLTTFVNGRGGNCTIVFAPGEYSYQPTFTTDNDWRSKVEMVDVENVTIIGYGVTIKQVKDPSWTAGDTLTNQESPIQFRSTGYRTCKKIKVFGLDMLGDNVPYSSTTGDGTCFGLVFRGVYKILLKDCTGEGWGTDGLYVGTTYGNTYKSERLRVVDCDFEGNTRQGTSIAGCDDFKFVNTSFTDTTGGSFGHGVDMEPNGTLTQQDGQFINCKFSNNERGATNFIRTSNVVFNNCIMDEQNTSGCVYMDGDADNIRLNNCNISTNKAVLYALGNNLTNIVFSDCSIKTTNLPANAATVRINPDGTQTNLDNIKFKDCDFIGTGGLYVKMDGEFLFENNKMNVSKQNSTSADVFGIYCIAKTYFKGNKIKINTDVVFAEKVAYISAGVFDNNELVSHANAIMSVQDDRTQSVTLLIRKNVFSQYFYYKGEHAQLNVYGEATIIQTQTEDATYNGPYRIVHGGYRRVVSGTNAKVGDIVYDWSQTTGNPLARRCTVAGSPGTWVGLFNKS